MHQTTQFRGSSADHRGLISTQQVAMRSIQKGIKRNDITQILGPVNQTYIQAARYDEKLYDEDIEVHENLGTMKKEFDKYRTQILKKEKDIQRLKTQLTQLKQEEQELSKGDGDLGKALKEVKDQSEKQQSMYQEAVMAEKSYKHIISRLKHDILCLKLRVNQMGDVLLKKKQEYYQADSKQQQSLQYNLQTQKLYDQMMRNIELEFKDKERSLLQFKNQLKARQQAKEKREERIQQQIEIAEHASNDKDINEKKWRKLLLVHKFVHSLLKNKMEKEMNKFAVVEHAYQNIKTATGITEAQEIVQKFLTKEQIYGQLLSTIAESEKKIEHLKQKNENWNQKLQQLKDEVQVMEMAQKPSKKGLDSDLYKVLYSVDEKAKKAEVMQQKVYTWTIKILSKLEAAGQAHVEERNNLYEQFERKDIQELFKYFQDQVLKEVDNSNPQEIDKVLSQLKKQDIRNETQIEDYNKRNVRVKFKRITQRENLKKTKSVDSSIDLSNRSQSLLGHSSNSSPSQSYYDSSSDEPSVDEGIETAYLNQIRDDIKNSNKKKKKESEQKLLEK